MIKRYIKFIIAHFALNCNSAFRSDLYFLKGFGDRRFSLFVTFGPCRLYRRKRGEPMKFQRIQDLRTDADLSQKQISDILHISQRSYSHYETGSRNIPIEMLIRLANYYETSIDYLVGRTDNKKVSSTLQLPCPSILRG